MEIGTCTCNHNGVTGSTCQQLHPAQPSHCELPQMGPLWTDVPWPALSSLAKFTTAPAKETHIQLKLYILGTETNRKMDVFQQHRKSKQTFLDTFFSFIFIRFVHKNSRTVYMCHLFPLMLELWLETRFPDLNKYLCSSSFSSPTFTTHTHTES